VKALWRRYAERIDALSLRERIMVFAAAAVVLLAPAWALFIDAEGAKQKRLVAALKQKQSEMKALEAQVAQLFGTHAGDAPATERIEQIRSELAEAEAQVAAEEHKFTAPSQVRAVIAELLGRNRAVSLVELKTLPVTSIAEARAAGGKPAAASGRLIYRHGIELTVAGAYLDLLAYLRDLESLPVQLYWGALEIDAVGYPKVTMKLTVYTLSLDRTWLKV
jgi:MSHA biogenesis protein MshJ